MKRQILSVLVGVLLGLTPIAGAGRAAERVGMLYVVDAVGQLARVDLADGSVKPIARLSAVMTDIAFAPNGALYGVDFVSVYAIDRATGAVDRLGPHGVSCGNALEITAEGDALVMGCGTSVMTRLALPSLEVVQRDEIGAASSGDIAASAMGVFVTVSGGRWDRLVRFDPYSRSSNRVGSLGFRNAYGLAWAPDGRLYAGAGGVIYEVDAYTAKAAPVYKIGRGGLKFFGNHRGGLRDFYGWAMEPWSGPTS